MPKLNLPVKYPCFFQNIAKIDVSIEEIRVQSNRLLKVMNRQPDLALRVEYAPQVTPGHGKIRLRFDCFQIACLFFVDERGMDEKNEEGARKRDRKKMIY